MFWVSRYRIPCTRIELAITFPHLHLIFLKRTKSICCICTYLELAKEEKNYDAIYIHKVNETILSPGVIWFDISKMSI